MSLKCRKKKYLFCLVKSQPKVQHLWMQNSLHLATSRQEQLSTMVSVLVGYHVDPLDLTKAVELSWSSGAANGRALSILAITRDLVPSPPERATWLDKDTNNSEENNKVLFLAQTGQDLKLKSQHISKVCVRFTTCKHFLEYNNNYNKSVTLHFIHTVF